MRIDPRIRGGVFAPIAGALQNTALQLTRSTAPLAGTLRFCILSAGCNSGAWTQMLPSPAFNGALAGTGVGGLVTLGGEGTLRVSLLAAPWTIKTVSVSRRTLNGGITFRTARGFVHGPASLTSSTVAESGVLQLVTGTQITQIGTITGSDDKGHRISSITLHLNPEPGLALLLAAGVAGLILLGRRRTR